MFVRTGDIREHDFYKKQISICLARIVNEIDSNFPLFYDSELSRVILSVSEEKSFEPLCNFRSALTTNGSFVSLNLQSTERLSAPFSREATLSGKHWRL